MGKIFSHLSITKRIKLEILLNNKVSKKQIASILGVHISTIYREIKRGEYQHLNGATWIKETRYSSDLAEKKYRDHLGGKGRNIKIDKDFELAEYIEHRIVHDKLSPLAVLGEIKYKGLKFKTSICVNTLYNYIKKGVFLTLSMRHLPMKMRKHHKKKVVIKRASRGTSIEMRPQEINDRNIFGHWEMDCVCGSSLSSLLVLTERLTRKEIIVKIPNKTTTSVINTLNNIEIKYGKYFYEIFKTITVDNGVEFSNVSGLEQSCINDCKRTKLYYCHPYSSYERGTNERINREIRRLIPKGSDISKYTNEDIEKVEKWVNTYPRQILNFSTSELAFNYELSKIICS